MKKLFVGNIPHSTTEAELRHCSNPMGPSSKSAS